MIIGDSPGLGARLVWKLFFMVMIVIMLVAAAYFVFVYEAGTESTWPGSVEVIDHGE